MEENHKNECGECVFCTSKCPECESQNIAFRLVVEYEVINSQEDTVHIDTEIIDGTQLRCEDCHTWLISGDPKLGKIINAYCQGLDIKTGPNWLTVQEDGSIKSFSVRSA